MNRILPALTALCVALALHAAAPVVGKPLPPATLSGKHGGTAQGRAWRSSGLRGRVRLLHSGAPDGKVQRRIFETLNRLLR
ncbi:hypothetical protein [Nitratifractor sp.]